jgi:hypothetical protein
MPRAQWLELLCKHTPDRYEHLVRYVGWYSNRNRGELHPALLLLRPRPAAAVEPMTEHALRAKAAWARLIRKVYEAGPREWPVMAGSCRSRFPIADIRVRVP